jgi:hypothetical protein
MWKAVARRGNLGNNENNTAKKEGTNQNHNIFANIADIETMVSIKQGSENKKDSSNSGNWKSGMEACRTPERKIRPSIRNNVGKSSTHGHARICHDVRKDGKEVAYDESNREAK